MLHVTYKAKGMPVTYRTNSKLLATAANLLHFCKIFVVELIFKNCNILFYLDSYARG